MIAEIMNLVDYTRNKSIVYLEGKVITSYLRQCSTQKKSDAGELLVPYSFWWVYWALKSAHRCNLVAKLMVNLTTFPVHTNELVERCKL